MKTAKQLFAEKGYDATGMEEIASNAGVPKSLIYYHFNSKEDLLNAVITEFVDDYKDILHDSRAEMCIRDRCIGPSAYPIYTSLSNA